MFREWLNGLLLRGFGWVPARVALGVLAFLGFVNQYMVRVNLSIAIVAMVRHVDTSTHAHAECLDAHNTTNASTAELVVTDSGGEEGDEGLEWDEITQSLVLASYFYGYTFTQVVGGRLAELFGTRWVFGGAILSSGILTLFTPLAATQHYGYMVALRVIVGLVGGVVWPSMHALLARWIPPIERPRFIATVYLAATLSVTFTYPLCGLIIDLHGWAMVFYVTGVLSLAWSLLWFTFMYSSPAQHPRISLEERDYIEAAVAAGGSSKGTSSTIPWRSIATSVPMWAIIVCDMGNTFGISIYATLLPTYMKNVLGFNIKKNGLLSGLPFLCRYVGGVISSTTGDWLLSRGHLSIVNTRRIFSAIAMLGPTAVMVGVAHSGCDPTIAVALLCFSLFLNGAITTSQLVNHTDIAPNFAGTLFGISNTFASIASFIAPMAVGAIISGQQTMGQWQKVFWMCVPVYGVTELFYLVFCSGTVQDWNYVGQCQKEDEEGHEVEPLN